MKTFSMICMTAMCGVLTLSSCSEEVMNQSVPEPVEGQSQLGVTTRGDVETLQSRLYVFNDAGRCVLCLSPDDHAQLVTTNLAAGTYDLYGIGSDDLSNFVLPTVDDATATTELVVAEGKQMGDLLMGHETITLADGDRENIDLQLERKVTHVTSITIHEVPSDVEQVSVTVSPMYQQILLNGTLADPSGTYTVNLTDQGSGDWAAEPDELILPSPTKPTITITFTKGASDQAYTYAAAQPIKANTHVSLEGTFVGLKGIVLTATMTRQSWDSTPNDLVFDFDEYPVAGQTYQGYFVVTHDPTNRTATLLNTAGISYTAPASNAPADWLAVIQPAMSGLAKPALAAAGDQWRLPTEAECRVFAKNTDYVMSFHPENGYGTFYLYQDDSALKWGGYRKTGNEVQFMSGGTLQDGLTLRPVIDITY